MYGSDIERMAAIAAEHVNGGKFHDGDFYSPEHRDKWIEAMTLATERLLERSATADALATARRTALIAAEGELAEAVEVMRKCLNYIENTEVEFGITLASGDTARAFLAKQEGRSGE